MHRDDSVYVGHILDTCRKALGKVAGTTRSLYDEDENLRLALAHLIQTMGEAARQVSREFQDRHPEIPWAKIIGMRHRVVHDYLSVDYDLVWDVATLNLPQLAADLGKIVPAHEGS
jgi:uncharacterized protein with HEPN domain